MILKEARHWIFLRLVPSIAALFIRVVQWTGRLTVLNAHYPDRYWDQGTGIIIAFWHGRLALMPLVRHKRRVHTILVSRHRDGEYISRTVSRFGLRTVRGSTTRGSLSGIRGMIRAFKAGSDLVVTPDGPRGPREEVQPGVIELASVTGAPIVPVTFGASKKKSSVAGTDSYCHILSAGWSSFGESRSPFPGVAARRSEKGCGFCFRIG